MKTRPLLRFLLAGLCVAAVAHAQGKRRNPTSKLYVADVVGEAEIDIGTEIVDLTKRSVFNAEGTTIQTTPSSNVSIVLSNGTGIYVDVDTRMAIRSFAQGAFRPNRADIEDEPSISATSIMVEHGVLGISSSKLVAGSTMTFETALATASIRGRQAVVQAYDNRTVISMVQGEATVQAGPLDRGHLLKNHEQMIIVPGAPGEPNIFTLQEIPPGEYQDDQIWLEHRVETADAGRKLVYFETQSSRAGRAGGGSSDGGLTLFDGGGDSSSSTSSTSEIVAVPVVPATSTVDPNVSPANLISR